MEAGIIGIATAFNFIVIMIKLKKKRYLDGLLDIGIFIAITSMFTGTIAGMSVGMVASAICSVYLWFNPPTIFDDIKKELYK